MEESCRHDDETQHEVVITQPFAMMQREVTEAQWETLMGNNPTESVPWHICPGKLNCPVNRVSWLDTLAFANALSDRAGLEPCYLLEGCAGEPGNHGDHVFECTRAELVDSCRGFRLPTEAEWEFAARAGTVTTFPCGNDERCLEGKEVLLGEPGADPLGPSVVGSRQPNPWGLYDMLGNVGEWVWDLHGPYPDSAVTDPLGATQTASGSHVFRGGAFYVDPCNSRPAVRYAGRPGWRDEGVGFRLVRTLTKSR